MEEDGRRAGPLLTEGLGSPRLLRFLPAHASAPALVHRKPLRQADGTLGDLGEGECAIPVQAQDDGRQDGAHPRRHEAVSRNELVSLLPEPLDGGGFRGPGIAVDGHHPPLPGGVDESGHLASESVGGELHDGSCQEHGQTRVHGVSPLLEDLHSHVGHQVMPRRHGSTKAPDLGSGPFGPPEGVASRGDRDHENPR